MREVSETGDDSIYPKRRVVLLSSADVLSLSGKKYVEIFVSNINTGVAVIVNLLFFVRILSF